MFPLRSPSLSRQVWLSLNFTLSHLTIYWSRQMGLFLFFLAKEALAYLRAAHFVAPMPVFPFFRASVFPLKPASFCRLFADLGSTNKSFISLLLLSDSCSVLATLSSPPPFLLLQSLWQKLSSFSSCTIRLQWVPDTRFSLGTMQLISWPDRERYSCPFLFLSLPLFSFLGLEAHCLI